MAFPPDSGSDPKKKSGPPAPKRDKGGAVPSGAPPMPMSDALGGGGDPGGMGMGGPPPFPSGPSGMPFGGSMPPMDPMGGCGDGGCDPGGGSPLLAALMSSLGGGGMGGGDPYGVPPQDQGHVVEGTGVGDPSLGLEELMQMLAMAQMGVGGAMGQGNTGPPLNGPMGGMGGGPFAGMSGVDMPPPSMGQALM